MDVGTWTGRPLAQVRRTTLWKELIHRPSHFRFPEGESFADAQARALTEIDAIAARHPRGRVAVGSHGDIIRMLLAHLAGAHLDLFQRTMADPALGVGRPPERGGPVRPARERHRQLGALRSPAAHREEPARIGRMDLGPVDRITADAVGEPGLRTFYLQARRGTDLVTLVVEKEQVRLLAASVLDLLATLGLETGTGPDEDEMDLEQPFEPRWRAGRSRSATRRTAISSCSRSRSSSPSSKRTTRCCSSQEDAELLRLWATREQMLALSRHAAVGGRSRPAHLPVLRQPARPGGTRVSRDERPLEADLTGPRVPTALVTGELELLGLLPNSSNYTFLARATAGDEQVLAVYKPRRGEMPLWDFPEGTLCQREVAAYVVARELGWPNVPPTVLRDGPGRRRLRAAVRASSTRRSTTSRWRTTRADDVPPRRAVRRGGEQRRPQGRPLPARRGRHDLGDRPRGLLQRRARSSAR